MPLWTGRFKKSLDKKTNDFNSSIPFDCRMAQQDIKGSVAHATMLGKQGIIDKSESEKIVASLKEIAADLENGCLSIDMTAEDIHTFVEGELTKRIGDSGKRLHTARSRNDQVALDLRLYLLDECDKLGESITDLIRVIVNKAMPGYTHLQRAQPITFGHHLLAYANMLLRDLDRLSDCKKRMAVSPLGSGALAGTTYPLDREYVAELLGLTGVSNNSLDGVSDRDYALELMSVLSIVMVHLSRFAEEIIDFTTMVTDSFFSLVWNSGVQMLIFLSGLQSISPSLYEAASVEGASGWETFCKITVPMLSPMILLNIIYTIVDSYASTSNGVIKLVINSISDNRFGNASAMAWTYFLVIGVIIGIVFFVSSRAGKPQKER